MKRSMRALLLAGIAAGVFGAPALAQTAAAAPAQAAPGAEDASVSEVVVTGFRSSLAKALEAKRSATTFQDSILAEDIGKFPDNNLAESLQRIPGVQIERANGEGTRISLRGLGPDYTRVTLNGLPMTPQIAYDGVNGRPVDLDLFPSELFSRLTVDKTARAGLIEGGLSGTVDLSIVHPFDHSGFRINYAAQGQYSEQAKSVTPKGSLIISNTWGEKFGALIGVAYSKRDVFDSSYGTINFNRPRVDQNGNGVLDNSERVMAGFQFNPLDPSAAAGVSPTALAQSYTARLARPELSIGSRERIGAAGSLQFRPTDRLSFDVDLVYTELAQKLNTFSSALAVRNSTQMSLSNVKINGNNTITQARFTNPNFLTANSIDNTKTKFYQSVLRGKYEVSDDLRIEGSFGYGKSTSRRAFNTFLIEYAAPNAAFADYVIPDTKNAIPIVTPSFDITKPAGFTLASIRNQPSYRLTDDISGRLSARYGSDEVNLTIGVAYDREKRQRQYIQYNFAPTFFQPTFQQSELPSLTTVSPSRYFFNVDDKLGYRRFLVGDMPALDKRFNFAAMQAAALASDPGATITREANLAGFIEGNAVVQLGGHDLRVNTGVRGVNTKQYSRYVFNGAPIAIDRSYFELLPSLNMAYDAADDVVLRFAAARTMTRPNPNQIEPVTGVALNGDVSNGNANLSPYFANQLDLGAEWYYGGGAALTVSAFYKGIDNFVAPVSYQAAFSTSGVPLASLDSQVLKALTAGGATIVNFSTYQNIAKRQTLKGAEVGLQQPLSAVLDGLGLLANFTYAIPNDHTRIVGLSKIAANGTVYYEKGPINLRLSYNYRSKYQTCTAACQDLLPDAVSVRGRDQFDFSSSYKLPIASDLSLTFEVINITNSDERAYFGSSERLVSYRKPGRQVFVGVRGQF